MKQVLFLLFIIFISCTKESAHTACRLSAIQSSGYSEMYEYNSAGQVTSYSDSEGHTQTYIYGKNGLVMTAYFSDGNDEDSVTYHYVYDSDNQLQKISAWNVVFAYSYNSFHQMVKTQIYGVESGSLIASGYLTFSYPSADTKNFSTINLFDHNGILENHNTLQYDTKPNPLPLPTSLIIPFVTTNNITQEIVNSTSTQTINYSYTYNSKGYPLKESNYYTYIYANCP